MPVTSYAPEFIELYKKASQSEVVIQVPTITEAHRLRTRLHTLRRDMRNEGHPLTTLANGVIISLVENEDESATLKAFPSDSAFLGYLHEAGVTVEHDDTLSTTESLSPLPEFDPEPDEVTDTLGTFFRGEKPKAGTKKKPPAAK